MSGFNVSSTCFRQPSARVKALQETVIASNLPSRCRVDSRLNVPDIPLSAMHVVRNAQPAYISLVIAFSASSLPMHQPEDEQRDPAVFPAQPYEKLSMN